MTRKEFMILMLIGYLATVGGVVWVWESWGLMGSGIATIILGLLVTKVKEGGQ